ncbi:MAG TPA: hypothetical protein VMV29_23950, partial [Ktedonobacterales bacterium]|nr:hypothetical protein [Ktedonobacterales bacterium]
PTPPDARPPRRRQAGSPVVRRSCDIAGARATIVRRSFDIARASRRAFATHLTPETHATQGARAPWVV